MLSSCPKCSAPLLYHIDRDIKVCESCGKVIELDEDKRRYE